MKRHWAMFALGLWIAGSICMSIVATQNFHTIDRLLAESTNEGFKGAVGKLGQPEGRDLLRYLSSELNRLYFWLWNIAQAVIGLLVLWLIAGLPARGARRIVLGMVAAVGVMLVWLQPEVTSLGRSLDFVPRDPAPPGMSRFWVLHGVYTSLELLKLLAGVVAAWLLSRAQEAVPRSLT